MIICSVLLFSRDKKGGKTSVLIVSGQIDECLSYFLKSFCVFWSHVWCSPTSLFYFWHLCHFLLLFQHLPSAWRRRSVLCFLLGCMLSWLRFLQMWVLFTGLMYCCVLSLLSSHPFFCLEALKKMFRGDVVVSPLFCFLFVSKTPLCGINKNK